MSFFGSAFSIFLLRSFLKAFLATWKMLRVSMAAAFSAFTGTLCCLWCAQPSPLLPFLPSSQPGTILWGRSSTERSTALSPLLRPLRFPDSITPARDQRWHRDANGGLAPDDAAGNRNLLFRPTLLSPRYYIDGNEGIIESLLP